MTTTTAARLTTTATTVLLLLLLSTTIPYSNAFATPRRPTTCTQLLGTTRTTTALGVSADLERPVETTADDDNNDDDTDRRRRQQRQLQVIPPSLRTQGRGIPSRTEHIQVLESRRYETQWLQQWEEETENGNNDDSTTATTGFDWEMEKARRWFAGLRMREDGTWVQQPSLFEFLVTRTTTSAVAAQAKGPGPVGMVDVVALTMVNILTAVGLGPSLGMAAVPTAMIQKYEGSWFSFIKGVLGGDLQTLAGGPLFLLLAKYFDTYGPIFHLSFGPKTFLVISDPVMSRHVLKESTPEQYCKGMLSDILEPIMGKGLIPADPATWRVRRRAIVPSFHKKWLQRMVTLFADRASILEHDLRSKSNNAATVVDLEERFCSVTLDIIGKAVFDYDFGSVTQESPIVKAVYRVLREAEHRSTSFIPYWNLPYADQWMGGQVEFRKDMSMLDDILADLINRAVSTRREATVEELEERDNAEDPSLLRFLVDMRGEDVNSMVLRDDLMTMLIGTCCYVLGSSSLILLTHTLFLTPLLRRFILAGHETTAAMLTWTLFELSQAEPGMLQEIQAEVRTVLAGKDRPDYDDIVAMKKLRFALIESLRLYPEPPLLIRRARAQDDLPPGSSRLYDGVKVLRGTDMFISTWNLHRSPDLWENPEQFDPTRWERSFTNPSVKGWQGYNPDKVTGLYPNEVASDFAFLPFGAGARKCVGDQFAMMEAVVTMSMMIKNFDFEFAIPPEEVGMKTGATIHTMNGLMMRVFAVDETSTLPNSNGWWKKQHLK